ncbi:MFS transporter [Nocardioides alcanivorans]|uniref:MFS transporter n=1 Tax=Nocardioides alcanivorans TaxID=2897352 RepID=UPI001F198E05|nr:MFS transporter [Nocardioides alcanivorans]
MPLSLAQWSLTVTLFVGALSPPLIGRLGAGTRRRTVTIICLALVSIGTLMAALPLGFEALVAGRALQGLGFGITPLAFAAARDQLPEAQARRALATISLANVMSAGLGFPIAAVIADLLGVKGAFWIAFGFTLVSVAVALKVIPPGAADGDGPVDWIGALLLGAATFGVLLAISRAEVWGYGSTALRAVLGLSAVLLVATVCWLLRRTNPLVDLRVAMRPGVLGAHVAGLLGGVGMYLMMATIMVLVQAGPEADGLGRSVTWAGFMLVPYAVASVVGNRIALVLGPVIGPDLLLPLGCLAFGASNLVLALWHDQLWQIALAMLIGGIGSGTTFNSIPWLVVRVVPAAETGSALALNVVVRMLGFAMGSALSVAVLAHFAEDGHPNDTGYSGAAWLGLLICVVAAAVCAWQARTARVALDLPTVR